MARFNLDTEHTTYFKGLPIPANGLLLASFPLIWFKDYKIFNYAVNTIIINPWFWYALIIVLSWLMVSRKPMLALKFSNVNAKKLLPFIIIAVVAIVSAFIIQWLAVPLCFLLYVILSLLTKQPKSV